MTRYVRGVSIYKPNRRNRKTDPYLLSYRDSEGKRRTESSSTHIQTAIARAHQIALAKDQVKHGLIDPGADRFGRMNRWEISKHVEEFGEWLIAKGDTAGHANETKRLVLRVLDFAGASKLSDMSLSGIQSSISALPTARGKEPLSNRSKDKAVRAMRNFSRWLRRDRRVASDVLDGMSHFDPETSRSRIRLPFSDEQLENLIAAADRDKHKSRCGINGPDRAILYRIATGTGFRFSACVALRQPDFHLAGKEPYIHGQASTMKARKMMDQPIRRDLAALLRSWLDKKPADAPLFAKNPYSKFMSAFRRDLAAAGIPYIEDGKHYRDFHALRHTYLTTVTRHAGLRVAQQLAGHSTPTMTAKYAHLSFDDFSKAMEALPAAKRDNADSSNRRIG